MLLERRSNKILHKENVDSCSDYAFQSLKFGGTQPSKFRVPKRCVCMPWVYQTWLRASRQDQVGIMGAGILRQSDAARSKTTKFWKHVTRWLVYTNYVSTISQSSDAPIRWLLSLHPIGNILVYFMQLMLSWSVRCLKVQNEYIHNTWLKH